MPHKSEKIARIKQTLDLPALLRSQGFAVTTHGKDLAILCPFHADSTPSLILTHKPNGWIWHCMACNKAGDAFTWIAHTNNLTLPHDFPKAVEALERWLGEHIPQTPTESTPTDHASHSRIERLSEEHYAILKQVSAYYHQTLLKSPQALEYLKKRGIYSEEVVKTFEPGYSDGSLYKIFPHQKKDSRKLLKEVGILRESGHEHLSGCLVIPLLNAEGNIVQMYGRRVSTYSVRKTASRHLYLSLPRQGVFNLANLNAKEIILCEALIDALSFYVNGHRNVTASFGVHGFTDEIRQTLIDLEVHRVYNAYDADKAGDEGSLEVAKTLHCHGIESARVSFPRNVDANLYALKMKPADKALALALQTAKPILNGHAVSYGLAGIGKVRPSSGVSIESKSVDNNVYKDAVTTKNKKDDPSFTQETCAKETDPSFSSLVVDQAERESLQVKTDNPTTKNNPSTELRARKDNPYLTQETCGKEEDKSFSSLAVDQPEKENLSDKTEELTTKERKDDPLQIQETSAKESVPNISPSLAVQNTMERTVIDTLVFQIAGGHRIRLGERVYEIYGLEQNLSRGRIKVSISLECAGKIHSDSIDLWISSQQERFIERASKNLSIHADIIHTDISKLFGILKVLQNERICEVLEKRQTKKPIIILSENERESTLSYLKAPGLMKRIAEDFARCGLVGEQMNVLLGYIVIISRVFKRPLALIIQSSSSAGKSTLMEMLISFCPEEIVEKYSKLTAQSLYHMKEDLSHMILAISEEEGIEEASYALKLLLSDGELRIGYPVKNPKTNKIETMPKDVKGPVSMFLTSTKIVMNEELENRCIITNVDESRDQTIRIHQMQRYLRTWEGLGMESKSKEIKRLHHNIHRLLRVYEVYNPYVDKLTYVNSKLRTRRDQLKYLTVIDAIALLHQYQREMRKKEMNGHMEDVVTATLEDVEWANVLCNEVMGKSLNDLSPQTQSLLDSIYEMVQERCLKEGIEQNQCYFTRREVRESTGKSESRIREHFQRLEEMEYVVAHKDKRGLYVYELLYKGEGKDGNKFLLGLLDIEKLK